MSYQACLFDAYGTLFNLHLPNDQLRAVVGDQADDLLTLWRQKQLSYTWLRGMMGRYISFEQVTEDALHYAFEAFGVTDRQLFETLMGIYWEPTPFPEVADTLRKLKADGTQTAILSNGSEKLLQAGVTHSGLTDLIDMVLSVEAVKTFKPQAAVYQHGLDRLGLPKQRVTFQSSNSWDVSGATAFGLTTVWIQRRPQPMERLGVSPAHIVADLSELPAMLDGADSPS